MVPSTGAAKKAPVKPLKAKSTTQKKASKALLVPWPVVWAAVTFLFLAGLFCRIAALDLPPAVRLPQVSATRWAPAEILPFLESDEKIYIALVEQLDHGNGYTLQGHAILREPWINLEQYDHPLFFHPPGGLAFFWLIHRLWPNGGFALAQVLSYGVFYWSVIALAVLFFPPRSQLAILLTGTLAAFSPIMTHVAGRFWLDGPLLAFTSLAAAVFLYGITRESTAFIFVAGLLLGYASLIKLTAFLVVPGLLAVTMPLLPQPRSRAVWWRYILFVLVAVTLQAPWEIWQWWTAGSPFPTWAGKPSADLVRTNEYVFYLTIWRQPWIYLELLPQVLWTLVPSILLLVLQWKNRSLRLKSIALLGWIATVVGAHIVLGFIGYSKLLRYTILVTPATIMLFSLVATGLIEAIREHQPLPGGRRLAVTLLVVAGVGMSLEIMQGIVTPLDHNLDLIKPMPGLRGLDYGQRMPWPPS